MSTNTQTGPKTWVRLRNDPLVSLVNRKPMKSWFTGCHDCEQWKYASPDRGGWLAALSWAEQHARECPEAPS